MRFFFLKNNRRNFLKTTLNFWFCGKSESFHCIRMGSHPFTLMVSYIKNNNNLDLEKVMINIYKKSLIFKGKIIKMVIWKGFRLYNLKRIFSVRIIYYKNIGGSVRNQEGGEMKFSYCCCWIEVGFEIWTKTKKTWVRCLTFIFDDFFSHLKSFSRVLYSLDYRIWMI